MLRHHWRARLLPVVGATQATLCAGHRGGSVQLIQTLRRARHVAYALTLFVVSAIPARASAQASQTSGTIRGRVVSDQGGAPITSVAVTVLSTETGLTRNAMTDADGVYTVRLLPPGVYRVSAKRIGNMP